MCRAGFRPEGMMSRVIRQERKERKSEEEKMHYMKSSSLKWLWAVQWILCRACLALLSFSHSRSHS